MAGLLPSSGAGTAGSLLGTGLSFVTGIPFLGSIGGIIGGMFGGKKRPRFQDAFWAREAMPSVTNRAQQVAKQNELFDAYKRGDDVLKYVRLEKGAYVLRTHLRPDTPMDKLARKERYNEGLARIAAKDAKKAARNLPTSAQRRAALDTLKDAEKAKREAARDAKQAAAAAARQQRLDAAAAVRARL